MNLDEAVKAHASWKVKLSVYLARPDRSIDPNEVGRDDHCPLGHWLVGEAKAAYSHLPEYKTLVAEHARFHQAVGNAVTLADAGKNLIEEHVLGWNSDFGVASRNIVSAIAQMKHRMQAAAAE